MNPNVAFGVYVQRAMHLLEAGFLDRRHLPAKLKAGVEEVLAERRRAAALQKRDAEVAAMRVPRAVPVIVNVKRAKRKAAPRAGLALPAKTFVMPRGNPGPEGSLSRRMWASTRAKLEAIERAYREGRLSAEQARAEAAQVHLEFEVFRNEHGVGAPTERRSIDLLGHAVPLWEPQGE